MSKKIEFTEEQIKEIIRLYTEEMLGTPSIGKIFGISKAIINRTLKENNIEMGPSGRKYKGGKKAADNRYYEKNKEKISSYYKGWAKDNRDKLRDYHAKWRDGNEDYKASRAEYERERVKSDSKYKLMKNTRTALWSCLVERNINKFNKTFNILGYSLDDLIKHLENQFTNGMSWDNYGEWHVDHIIGMSNFTFTSINDYEFKKCWELDNLRPMWSTTREVDGVLYEGNLNKGSKLPDTCYQYRIREKMKKLEEDKLQFNIKEISLDNAYVKIINKNECKEVIEEYEWLGYMPNYTKYHFGLFFKVDGEEYLGGVLSFQQDYVENVGGWDKYDYSGKILLLSRGVCVWWTPKNSASFLISKALNWLGKNTDYKVITATVDGLAGEIGTIYQSCNWVYTGVMDGNILKNGKPRERMGVIIDGKLLTSRQIRGKLGTMKKSVILEHYPEATFVKQKAKERYFYFLGSRKEKKYYKSKIQDQIKPYPKRG
jgi:hypothetical protein